MDVFNTFVQYTNITKILMKREVINNHIVILYDSIDELPIIRFHKYNKYMLIDSGIGSDLNDINVHIDTGEK